MIKWLLKLITETDEKKLKQLYPLINKINLLESEMKTLSDEALAGKTAEFKKRISDGISPNDILLLK